MPQHVLSGALFADDAQERERLTRMLNSIGVTLSFTGRLADHAAHDCSSLDLRLLALDAATPAGLGAILALPPAAQPPICLFYPAFTLSGVLLACSVGVNGHALSTTSADDLAAGLQVIAQNGLFFCPTIWAGFAHGYLQPVHGLTLQDVRLLALVANGETNRVIAQVFAVSPKLIERRIQHLCTNVGVRNRTELAAWWGRQLDAVGELAPTALVPQRGPAEGRGEAKPPHIPLRCSSRDPAHRASGSSTVESSSPTNHRN